MSTATSTSTATAIWAPCPMCWGQGRIYQDHNGEGLVPSRCATCLGLGEHLVEDAPVGHPVPRAPAPVR
jgi:DnaJ-class molecular chaperone